VTTHSLRTMAELSDDEKAILDFEGGGWWKYAGAKETAIREAFGWSATRYFQVLNALLDRPEAVAYSPLLVKRLTRLRDARRGQRSSRRVADST
jgi:hypothetical protein